MILAISRLLSALPLAWALGLGRAGGWFWHYCAPVRRGVARRNVERVFGPTLDKRAQRQLVRRAIRHFGMYAVESLRLPMLTRELSETLIDCEGYEHVAEAYARGKGVIAVTAHMGSFDLLACGMAIRGHPMAVIFKEISWKAANDFWFAVRRRTGIQVISPRRSKDEIKATLARNHAVAFIVDQHMAKHRAIVCEFFGHLAATSPAAVRFAFETGATILPLYIHRAAELGRHVAVFEPPIVLETPHAELGANIRHNTERLLRIVEGWIQKDPDQWLWLHRRWKVHDNPSGWDVPPELRLRYVGPHAPLTAAGKETIE